MCLGNPLIVMNVTSTILEVPRIISHDDLFKNSFRSIAIYDQKEKKLIATAVN